MVEIQGIAGISVTEDRSQGFKDALQRRCKGGIKIVASQPADFLPDKGLSVMENILQAQKDIDAVYTHDDDMAEGVVAAIQNAGREDEMFLTGAGGSKAAMEQIKKGGLYRATFLYNPSMSSSAINLARLIASDRAVGPRRAGGAEQDHGDRHHGHQGQRRRRHGPRLLAESPPAGRLARRPAGWWLATRRHEEMPAQGADSYVAVVDVGGTTLKGALADRTGALFLRDRRDTSPDHGPEAVLEAILCLIDDLVAEGTRRHGARGLAGIGVGDSGTGRRAPGRRPRRAEPGLVRRSAA